MARLSDYAVKDSGIREEFTSGMRRDTNKGKERYDLVVPKEGTPMLKRWAIHMAKGADKYGDRNWEMAAGTEELERFRESAFRHFMQWFQGEVDEDHAAAVFFNIQGAEYVTEKLGANRRICPACGKVREETMCRACGVETIAEEKIRECLSR